MTPDPTQSNVMTALRSFLLEVLPAGTEVIAAQQNRTPEPIGPNFVVMTPLRVTRLRTNIDDYLDVRFTGAIVATLMTVSAVAFGIIRTGATVFGLGVTPGTVVVSQTSGPTGGAGTYVVSPTQTVTSRTLASGGKTIEQGAQVSIQLDFHSDDNAAGDMAMTVATLMRDAFATQQFAGQSPNYGIVPLLADDPHQAPFVNEAQQYETRWTVEAMLQANLVLSVPQQFADSVQVEVISVDATYPP